MTKRIFAAILATVILLTLAGCANKAETLVTDTTEQAATVTVATTGTAETATEPTEEKKNGIAEETPPAVTIEPQVPSAPATDPTETESAKATPSVIEPTPTETAREETKPLQTEPTRPSKDEESTAEPDIPPNQTEEQPTETKPEVTEPPKATEPPAETQPTETTEPEPAPFDIDYWIAYAKGYAESKELVLNHTAIDCWDNPIRAGSHCLYLERDIQSRLNRYARDADITDVWVWAEPAGNDCYDIYIGYA